MQFNQISVFLENRAGSLSKLTKVLSENNIDLRAINIAETADYGILRLIVNDSQKASEILLNEGFILKLTPVIAVAIADHPGGLNELLEILAHEDIDVKYMYSLFETVRDATYMILQVANIDKAVEILAANKFTPARAEDLGIC